MWILIQCFLICHAPSNQLFNTKQECEAKIEATAEELGKRPPGLMCVTKKEWDSRDD